MSGARCLRGEVITGERAVSHGSAGEFDYIPGNLAQAQVRKMALELVSEIARGILDEVLDNVAVGKVIRPDELNAEEKSDLQKSASYLSEKMITRNAEVPNVVKRAAQFAEFGQETLNDFRKLLAHLTLEFQEDIENEGKAMFLKTTEDKKKLQELARKEMYQSKHYDYSKYAIPNLKAMKKPKPMLPLQNVQNLQSPGVGGGNYNLPSGGTVLEATGSKTYLSNLRKQQNRTIKVTALTDISRMFSQYSEEAPARACLRPPPDS